MNKHILLIGASLLAYPLAATAQTEVKASTQAGARVEWEESEAHAATSAETRASASGRSERPPQGAGGEAALAATAEAGLPQAPVRSIIAEGRARGASAAEIDRAALTVQSRLEASARALRENGEGAAASDAEIVAGAEALASGARPQDLSKLRDSAPADRSLTASLSALAELTATGVAPARAASELAAQLRAGASDAAITRLATNGEAVARLQGGTAAIGGAASGALGVGAAAGGITGAVTGAANLGVIR